MHKKKKCKLMHDLIDKMSFISLERPFEIPYAHKRGSVKKYNPYLVPHRYTAQYTSSKTSLPVSQAVKCFNRLIVIVNF